jgi:hypothetical protein
MPSLTILPFSFSYLQPSNPLPPPAPPAPHRATPAPPSSMCVEPLSDHGARHRAPPLASQGAHPHARLLDSMNAPPPQSHERTAPELAPSQPWMRRHRSQLYLGMDTPPPPLAMDAMPSEPTPPGYGHVATLLCLPTYHCRGLHTLPTVELRLGRRDVVVPRGCRDEGGAGVGAARDEQGVARRRVARGAGAAAGCWVGGRRRGREVWPKNIL